MNIDLFLAPKTLTVIEAMSIIDKNGYGILYVTDENKKLLGCLSDGDIRRWIIKTNNLNSEISALMNTSPKFIYETELEKADEIEKNYPINSLPVLNIDNKVTDIILFKKGQKIFKKNIKKELSSVSVIIMAGGKGTRLYPYTKILPKPLIPIGDTPILERILNKFSDYGIKKYFLTVNYKKNMIKSYFNETPHEYDLNYVEEDKPLGTAGSIKLIDEKFTSPVIVANCDQLIDADYNDLYRHHNESGNIVTIVSSLKNITIPYGVLNTKENGELLNLEEKPTLSFFINTGMYVINPEIIDLIPENKMFHMTHLIEEVQKNNGKVGIYPISEESFLDMGEFTEMKRMEEKLSTICE